MLEIVNYLSANYIGKTILVFFVIGVLFSVGLFSAGVQDFFNWLRKYIKFMRGDDE